MLQVTIAWFAGFTFLQGLSAGFAWLLVARSLQGLGFGGEWAAGSVLAAEAIRSEHRGKAVGAVQSSWGSAQGFCYNFGRGLAAGFPLLVGLLSARLPLGQAIGIYAAGAYLLMVIVALALPETRGKNLREIG